MSHETNASLAVIMNNISLVQLRKYPVLSSYESYFLIDTYIRMYIRSYSLSQCHVVVSSYSLSQCHVVVCFFCVIFLLVVFASPSSLGWTRTPNTLPWCTVKGAKVAQVV